MAEFSVNTKRYDPYRAFLFQVVVDGVVAAGVSKVGALTRTTEVVSHRPGNAITQQFHSPGLTNHEPIVLERGVTFDLYSATGRTGLQSRAGGVSLRLPQGHPRHADEPAGGGGANLQGLPLLALVLYGIAGTFVER